MIQRKGGKVSVRGTLFSTRSPKTHYVDVWVDSDGKAQEECKKTKQYKERKKNKPNQLKASLKEKWNQDKPEREKKEKERQDRLKALKEHRDKMDEERKQREKTQQANDKKKQRMGKCAPVVALMIGAGTSEMQDQEHPYDWTSDYFDEDFIDSDDRLPDWPQDVDVETIAFPTDVGVDPEAWMKSWENIVSAKDMKNYVPCSSGKRSLHGRCKRSADESFVDVKMGISSDQNTSIPRISKAPVYHRSKFAYGINEIEKRNPAVIFVEIAAFVARLGVSLLSRTVTSITRWAPRLANLAKNTDRLFKIAPKGQGGAKNGVEGMKNAFKNIVNDPRFKQCVKDGIP